MKDDIKEILYNPKILMLSYGNYISLDNYIKLKDYITNLQQRTEKAIELLNREYWINEHEHNDKVIDELLNILQGGGK